MLKNFGDLKLTNLPWFHVNTNIFEPDNWSIITIENK